MTSNKNIRYDYWDNIKGFLIFLVVFGHFLLGIKDCYELNNLMFNIIYSFHMSAFVFVSGYFSKSENSRTFNSLIYYIMSYLILQSGFIFWNYINAENGSLFEPLYSSWYLLALVVWRISITYIERIRYILPILIIISLFSIFYPNINMQFGIIKIIAFYPFFMLGYLLKKEHVEKIIAFTKIKKISIALFTTMLAIIVGIFSFKFFNTAYTDLVPVIYPQDSTNANNLYSRISIYIVSFLVIITMLLLSFEKKIPIITKLGKNSFTIYFLHRTITLLMSSFLLLLDGNIQLIVSFLLSLIICIIIGSDRVDHCLKAFIDNCVDAFSKNKTVELKKYIVCRLFMAFIFLISLFISLNFNITSLNVDRENYFSPETENVIYRVIDDKLHNKIENSLKILFTGDLILLEDQVKRAYNGKTYDFSEYFKYANKYIKNADFAIGVLEGPFGGNTINYSQSNYDDGKLLYINFPNEFANSIKDAGYDLVTTANNHILDVGLSGHIKTIKVLNKSNIDYIGSYKNIQDKNKNRVKVIEKDGIKIAILAYTYGINNYITEDLYNDSNLSYITNFLPNVDSKLFNNAKKDIEKDFKIAKKYNPDLIIVIPHWGTQFEDTPDKNQLAWQKIFINYGADIILGCHTHSVQPVYIKNNKFTLFSPGNFANIYHEYNGDASMMVEIYIDRKTKKVFSGAIIPMWTQSLIKGNYRAIPIYEIFNNEELSRQISTYELKHIESVLKHITKIALNTEIDFKMIVPKYYFDEKGFIRTMSAELKINKLLKNKFYNILINSKNVCFIGDSITQGTKNGGIPWYEPIKYLIKGEVSNVSWGGETSLTLLNKNHLRKIISKNADTYIIAIGTNDIRYQNNEICALSKEEYINNLKILRNEINKKNNKAKFVFIAPWYSTDGDKLSIPSYAQRLKINKIYSEALEKWCKGNKDTYINPNMHIKNILDKYPNSEYLLDAIHPNGFSGVKLYSEAVLIAQ